MRRLLHICVGVLLLPGIALAGDEPKKEPAKAKEPAKKIVVPFELIKTQHMIVNVKINGKGPYRLVFDTGAPDSLISNKVANEANVFPKGFKKPFFALFGSMGQFPINDLEVGELKAKNVSAMVIDHPTVQAIATFVGGPIEGIVGFTFYAKYKMSIDYEKSLITFEPGKYQPSNMVQDLEKRLMLPRAVRDAPRILAPAGLLGIQIEKGNENDPGILVKQVVPESPAAAAGLKAGDRLLTLDGRWTDSVIDCYIACTMVRVGAPVAAEISRAGKKMRVQITFRAGL